MNLATRTVLLVVLGACSRKKAPPPPRPELIETIRSLADRVCACETDKDCVRAVRDEWDAGKQDLMNHGLLGEDRVQFDTELNRMRACGDGGGLTFWMPPPPQE